MDMEVLFSESSKPSNPEAEATQPTKLKPLTAAGRGVVLDVEALDVAFDMADNAIGENVATAADVDVGVACAGDVSV